MSKKVTQDGYVSDCKNVHNNFYTYERTVYVYALDKLIVTCPVHGDWEIQAASHKAGTGCRKCADVNIWEGRRKTTPKFISESKDEHGDLYDYSLTEYKGGHELLTIICPIHGKFELTASKHLNGRGCSKCGRQRSHDSKRSSNEEFSEKGEKLWGTKYNYSLVDYKSAAIKVKVICPEHGVFKITPNSFLSGSGCPACVTCGYQQAKPGNIYILQSDNLFKVGITNRKVERRLKDINKSSGLGFTIVYSKLYEDGSIPNDLENIALKHLRSTYQSPTEKFDGSTECFYDVDFEQLVSLISNN